MSKTTPRPWVIKPHGQRYYLQVSRPETNDDVFIFQENDLEAKANAELIVRAVNCHEEMIKILEKVQSILEESHPSLVMAHLLDESNEIKDLLKRAKGE